jgi:plastocyanin domain-containing protein
VEVVSGVQVGDRIVTDGSFSLRAERDRLGMTPDTMSQTPAATGAGARPAAPPAVQEARVVVAEQGFDPAKLTLRAGTLVRITFVRTTEKTCATEVVFPSLNIRRPLPLNQPVAIEFTPKETGEIAFACGVNMFHGTIVVE